MRGWQHSGTALPWKLPAGRCRISDGTRVTYSVPGALAAGAGRVPSLRRPAATATAPPTHINSPRHSFGSPVLELSALCSPSVACILCAKRSTPLPWVGAGCLWQLGFSSLAKARGEQAACLNLRAGTAPSTFYSAAIDLSECVEPSARVRHGEMQDHRGSLVADAATGAVYEKLPGIGHSGLPEQSPMKGEPVGGARTT